MEIKRGGVDTLLLEVERAADIPRDDITRKIDLSTVVHAVDPEDEGVALPVQIIARDVVLLPLRHDGDRIHTPTQ